VIRFRPLTTQDEWCWCQRRTHIVLCADMKGIIAYDEDDGSIVAACVADSFGPDNCNVHIAIDNPMVIRRGFLSEIAHWLFDDCGRKRLLGLVPANNERARRFDEHIGFTEIARVPDGFATGIDYIILAMERDNCPWLKENRRAA